MSCLYGSSCVLLMALLLVSPLTSGADSGWERHDVTGSFAVDHPRFAHPRTIEPKCSGGPVVTQGADGVVVVRPGEELFSFFVHHGRTDRLLIFFDGGGACWDKNTCLLSPFSPQPTYEQEVTEHFDVEGAPLPGGILDLENPVNPFHGWTMVFIPYCTGDVHWGSSEAEYTLPPIPDLLPNGLTSKIYHRGFDNFLAVLDALKDQLPGMKQVAVAGSSAGAYGAIATFPFIQEVLPKKARTYLLADAGNGVINQQFVTNAIKEQWDVVPNLATWVPGISASLLDRRNAANTLEVSLVSSIARAYPGTRIAQYTTAWDAVQTQFLNIMDNINDPTVWSLGPENPNLVPAFCAWSARAQIQAYVSALAKNYRFYIGAGTNHTALPGVPLPGFGDIYAEDSAQGVPMLDWVDAMLRNGTSASGVAWDNVRCSFGQCEPPFPAVLCLGQ